MNFKIVFRLMLMVIYSSITVAQTGSNLKLDSFNNGRREESILTQAHIKQQEHDLDLFNQQMTIYEDASLTGLIEDNSEEDKNSDLIDLYESGGDTKRSPIFEDYIDLAPTPEEDAIKFEPQILDISGSSGKVNLQDFVVSKTKNTGVWASQFIFINKSGQRSILSSLNSNLSIKPASTLKLFTGYLAFLEKSYPIRDLSSMLHRSDNDMADAALISVAKKNGHQSESRSDMLDSGLVIMKDYFKNLEDSSKFHPVNGSGLNTTDVDQGAELNKATVRMETHLLEKIIRENNYNIFKKLLAQPSQFGTLRGQMKPVARLGQVYAKTGTLAKTKALAGYVETKNGILVFAMIGDELKISPKVAFRQVITNVVLKHVQEVLKMK